MRIAFLLIFLIPSGLVFAQDAPSSKVLYHSNKLIEGSTRLARLDLNRILIDKNTTISWLDGHGVAKQVFAINSISGSLQLDRSGEVTYQVSSEKGSGRFIVKKTNALIRITAILVIAGKPTSNEFEVVSYNVID